MCQCCCCGCKAKKGFPDEFLPKGRASDFQKIGVSDGVPFSEWFRRELNAKHISLGELSRRTKIPKSTLHGWMYGRIDIVQKRFERLIIHLRML